MSVIWALVRKDLEDAFRNQTVLFALIVPILLASFLFKVQNPEDFKRPHIALVAGPDSGLARNLETTSSAEMIRVTRVDTVEGGLKLLDSRKVVALINCTTDFDRELRDGRIPPLDVTYDAARPIQAAIVTEVLHNAVREQAGQKSPADIHRQRRSGGVGHQESLVAAWILFSALTALTISASSMGEEKEAGTLQQIMQSPAMTSQILIGKSIVGSALATVSAGLILVLNASPAAAWLNAAVLVSLGTVAFSLLGVVIGLLAEGPTAINSWTGLVFIALFVPAAMAETSQTMSRVAAWSPAFYFQDGLLKALLGQRELAGLAQGIAALAILGGLALAVGAARLRRLPA